MPFAQYQYRTTTLSFVGLAMPVFWLGLILQIAFTALYKHTGVRILYTAGLSSVDPGHGFHFFIDRVQHLVLPVITLLAAVLAPAEVWLGTLRLIFVFAVGHVGATLITALALSQGALSTSGPTAHGTAGAVDVGVSYGLFCVAGVLTYRIPGPWRFLYAGVLVGVFAFFAFVVGRTFTDFGHFVTVLIGLAIYPLVRSRSVERRARIPLYRPWQDGLETAPSLSRVT